MKKNKLHPFREKWLRQIHQELVAQAEAGGASEARLALSDTCFAVASKRAGVWMMYFIL